jgi:DUF971 family protein
VTPPKDIQVVGTEVAVLWPDGVEHYIPAPFLRANSPSAEVAGERDIFGVRHGGEVPRRHDGVRVLAWHVVGAYAARFEFSDGHRTGIYTWALLRRLGEAAGGAGTGPVSVSP